MNPNREFFCVSSVVRMFGYGFLRRYFAMSFL